MKNLLVGLSLFLCLLAHAAMPIDADMNGAYWRRLDEKAKPVFLAGFLLGTNQYNMARAGQAAKLVSLIDAFYKTHGDYPLLRYAVQIGVLQLEGKPQEQIDEVIKESERPWK